MPVLWKSSWTMLQGHDLLGSLESKSLFRRTAEAECCNAGWPKKDNSIAFWNRPLATWLPKSHTVQVQSLSEKQDLNPMPPHGWNSTSGLDGPVRPATFKHSVVAATAPVHKSQTSPTSFRDVPVRVSIRKSWFDDLLTTDHRKQKELINNLQSNEKSNDVKQTQSLQSWGTSPILWKYLPCLLHPPRVSWPTHSNDWWHQPLWASGPCCWGAASTGVCVCGGCGGHSLNASAEENLNKQEKHKLTERKRKRNQVPV